MSTNRIQLNIEGMTCNGCANRVAKAIRELPGVVDATVSVADRSATITCEPPTDASELVAAVEAKGYRARVAS